MTGTGKNGSALLLMGLSMGLLLLFQAFWLRKAFDEQRVILEQTVDNIFQKTANALQDSLFQNAVLLSNLANAPSSPTARTSSFLMLKDQAAAADATPALARILNAKNTLIWTDKSIPENVSVQIQLDSGKGGDGSRILLEIKEDTVSAQQIQQTYQMALRQMGIQLPFYLREGVETPVNTGICTQKVMIGLVHPAFYTAVFPSYGWFVLKKTMPQIVLSLLLLLLTGASFFLVFRNLRRQQHLAQLKNDFIGNITHELKTPITTIGVALEALGDFDGLSNPTQTKEYLEISKLELNRLSLLVDKALRTATFEQKNAFMHLESVDFLQLVHSVSNAMKLQLDSFGGKIALQLPEGHLPPMTGDKTHLANLLFNLLDNAIKYRRMAEPLVIDIHVQAQSNGIQFCVSDNGMGMEKDQIPLVFGKFYRISSGNTHNVKGHGLGLTYVAGVIREHKGTIAVESTPGQGSAFTIFIPYQITRI